MNKLYKKQIELEKKIQKLDDLLDVNRKKINDYNNKVINKEIFNLLKHSLNKYSTAFYFKGNMFPTLSGSCDFSIKDEFEQKFLNKYMHLQISDIVSYKGYDIDFWIKLSESETIFQFNIPIKDIKHFIKLFKFDIKNMEIKKIEYLEYCKANIKAAEDLHLLFK
jgi:hypothetical protein